MNAQREPTGCDEPAPAPSPAATPPRFDRMFIEDHHPIERYLTGKPPLKGANDLENWCRANPQCREELQLGQRTGQLEAARGRGPDIDEARLSISPSIPTLINVARRPGDGLHSGRWRVVIVCRNAR